MSIYQIEVVEITDGRYKGRTLTFRKNILFGSVQIKMSDHIDALRLHYAFGQWYATRARRENGTTELSTIATAPTDVEAYEAGVYRLWPQ